MKRVLTTAVATLRQHPYAFFFFKVDLALSLALEVLRLLQWSGWLTFAPLTFHLLFMGLICCLLLTYLCLRLERKHQQKGKRYERR